MPDRPGLDDDAWMTIRITVGCVGLALAVFVIIIFTLASAVKWIAGDL